MNAALRSGLSTLCVMTLQGDPKRAAAEKIVGVLHDAGHVAYLAGGCVRDMLLGMAAKDYDVATDAPPPRIAELFHNTRHVGEAFGVMLVRLMRCEIEVATFRAESGYSDGRRPDHVHFTDAEHDARRRDFTINGLFYDPREDRVVDYVDGRADLQRGVVRAIGDPDARLGEDYLRMLRAVRFAARLGFVIDPPTRAAIERHAPRLGFISRERIGMEMRLIVTGPNAADGVELLQALALDAPAFDGPHVRPDIATLRRLDQPGVALALTAVLIDRHIDREAARDPAAALDRVKAVRLVRQWRSALALSNDERDRMAALLGGLRELFDWNALTVARKKRTLARPQWQELSALFEAFTAVYGLGTHRVDLADVPPLQAEGVAPRPLIGGDDLVAAGFAPGPMFKRVLDAVYDAQLEHRVTDRGSALALAQQLAAQQC